MIIRFVHLDRVSVNSLSCRSRFLYRYKVLNGRSIRKGEKYKDRRRQIVSIGGTNHIFSSLPYHTSCQVSTYCTKVKEISNDQQSLSHEDDVVEIRLKNDNEDMEEKHQLLQQQQQVQEQEQQQQQKEHQINKVVSDVESDKKKSDLVVYHDDLQLHLVKKPPLRQRIKEGLLHMWHHYRDGGKLLAFNIKCCAIILKRNIVYGEKMNRRERRLLLRTFSDLFRLIPLTAFIIIPFAELALPFALVLFPNMLPSTFTDKEQKKKSVNKILVETENIGNIMRDAFQRKAKKMDDPELLNFVKKIKSGGNISLEEIYQYAKVFEEDLTVEGLERKQAQAMCRLVGIQPFGPETILRRRLANKLDEIKKDDLLIYEEGIDSLDEEELEEACRIRGIYWKSARSAMKRRLKDWLKLSVEQNVPISLLIYSRTLVFPNERLETALTKSLANIPVELVEDIEIMNEPLQIEQLEKEIMEDEEDEESLKVHVKSEEEGKETVTITTATETTTKKDEEKKKEEGEGNIK